MPAHAAEFALDKVAMDGLCGCLEDHVSIGAAIRQRLESRDRQFDLAACPAEGRGHLAGDLVAKKIEGLLRRRLTPGKVGYADTGHGAYSAASRAGRKPPDWRFHNCA